jgi:hypothetical protein
MAEQAARAYLAEYLAGNDVVLTAFEHRECLDLSRRVQGYLLDWGQIRPGSTAALQEGACGYVGDLIVARENDNQLDAGQPGRTLANGDLLRVEAIGANGLTVSRMIRPSGGATSREWSASFTISSAYAAEHCDLGYALTWYTVEGCTGPLASHWRATNGPARACTSRCPGAPSGTRFTPTPLRKNRPRAS